MVYLEIDKICRVCLKADERMSPLFGTRIDLNEGFSYASMIAECTKYEVSQDDTLPQLICFECMERTQSVYEFKKLYEASHRTLMEFLTSPSVSNQHLINKCAETEDLTLHPSSSFPKVDGKVIVKAEVEVLPSEAESEEKDSNTKFKPECMEKDELIIKQENDIDMEESNSNFQVQDEGASSYRDSESQRSTEENMHIPNTGTSFIGRSQSTNNTLKLSLETTDTPQDKSEISNMESIYNLTINPHLIENLKKSPVYVINPDRNLSRIDKSDLTTTAPVHQDQISQPHNDDDLGDLLKSWNLYDEMYTFLKEHKFSINCLKLMKERHIDELFSTLHNLPLKIFFEHKLNNWQRANGYTAAEGGAYSTLSTSKRCVTDSPPSTISNKITISVQEILNKTQQGKSIIECYKKKKHLSPGERTTLVHKVIQYFTENELTITVKTCENLAVEIVKIFPTEILATYFVKGKGKIPPKGKLYDRYRTSRRSLVRKAIEAGSGRRNKRKLL